MENATINPVRLYKMSETAEILGILRRDVRDLIDTKQIKSRRIRPNANPRISGKAILEYIERDE